MRFGRIFEGVIVEVTTPPPGRTIDDVVGEIQAEDYYALPDTVDLGWTKDEDGKWIAPTSQLKEGVTP